ncbi:MAG: BlaI/MecI/CopY family transcriptional regulator [Terriglobales bacterium]
MLFEKMSAWFESSLADRLGPLESQLLRLLWERGDATVRELVATGEVSGAYTTVMTTLDRLYKKGVLERVPEGRAFRYSPRLSREEFRGTVVRRAIGELLGAGNHADPMSYLVEAVSEHDRSLLDELEKAIERKRRELRKKGGR